MNRINVTQTFMPPLEEYQQYLSQIWENKQLTNQGPLLHEFEKKAKEYLELDNNFHFVANGTIALQLAIRALDSTEGEIVTTPFSYVASTSSILWEGYTPVFVDIDPETFCIDPNKIESAITDHTKAILAVHVFGNPCDVVKIGAIARKHNIKVIYDAAHAFGVEYKGHSILSYGDISTCSFHATKVFHTIEGGAVITPSQAINDRVELQKRFGHNYDNHIMLGINAKASEFHAAMGLCNLNYIDSIIENRKNTVKLYDHLLGNRVQRQVVSKQAKPNYAYYPVVFESEGQLLEAITNLEQQNIFPRRYFYPSLNKLPYITAAESCPASEELSKRIMCLPLYAGMDEGVVTKICKVINT